MKTRVMIIGLDGASLDIILPWVRDGKLPNIGKLINEGVYGHLESTTPPISSAAWVSFMTGLNPGKHGVCKFEEFDFTGYYEKRDYAPVSSKKYAGKTMYDMAGSHGKKIIAHAIPLTYPAWPVNGIMNAGWPIPDTAGRERIYPSELNEWREKFPEYLDVDFKDRKSVLEKLRRNIHRRFLQVNDLLQKEWDIFTVVLGETDQVQHFFWRYMEHTNGINTAGEIKEYSRYIFEVYSYIDKYLGEILQQIPENVMLMIMSDHGGCLGPTKVLRINHWLRSSGLLKDKASIRKNLAPIRYEIKKLIYRDNSAERRYIDTAPSNIKWPLTKAYFVPLWHPVGGIGINLKGRQKEGIVENDKEYNRIREEIISELLKITDKSSGKKVIVRAHKREDVYDGPFVESFPDIIFEVDGDYHLEAGLNSGQLIYNCPESLLTGQNGHHSMNGVIIVWGKSVKKGVIKDAKIVDIAPTVLYSVGSPVSEQMDGKVITDIFTDKFLAENPVTFKSYNKPLKTNDHDFSDDEVASIQNQLKNLGYL